jgi:hypothetical protein
LETDPTVQIQWSEVETGHWRAVCQCGSEDVYEEPRDVLDLSVTQRFTTFLEARLAFKNLLGKESRYTTGDRQVFFGYNKEAREASLSL